MPWAAAPHSGRWLGIADTPSRSIGARSWSAPTCRSRRWAATPRNSTVWRAAHRRSTPSNRVRAPAWQSPESTNDCVRAGRPPSRRGRRALRRCAARAHRSVRPARPRSPGYRRSESTVSRCRSCTAFAGRPCAANRRRSNPGPASRGRPAAGRARSGRGRRDLAPPIDRTGAGCAAGWHSKCRHRPAGSSRENAPAWRGR